MSAAVAPRSVLHVIPAIARRYGGPSTAVFAMCRAVQARGLRTTIATTDADGPSRLPHASGGPQDIDGVPTLVFAKQVSESFKWSAGLARWLYAHVGEFDVVHVHAVFSHPSLAAGRAARAAGVPYIVRPLGTLDPWSLGRHAWRKRVLLSAGGRRLLERAAGMHYTTVEEQRLAETTLQYLPRGSVIPLGVDDAFYDVRAGRSGSRLLIVARLDPKKGVDLLIEAFHRVATHDLGDWWLDIAGDGDPAYVDALRRQAAAGPGRARIVFHGWVDLERRRQLLASAGVFVLPSAQENFGIAVVEAMAAGVPTLLCPGVNVAGEVAAAGGGWICERTPEALAGALEQAMRDPADRARRAAAAARFAARYRWSETAEPLAMLYRRVSDTCAA